MDASDLMTVIYRNLEEVDERLADAVAFNLAHDFASWLQAQANLAGAKADSDGYSTAATSGYAAQAIVLERLAREIRLAVAS